MNIKKTILISAASLGMLAGIAAVNSDNASAKTYAKVTSNKTLTTDATTRNVTFNGSNALYNKAGTLKGARKVATTTTLNNLANSNSSKKNFRAYRVATTNRGSVYYKIVAFDKSYRGWIYGGKTVGNFSGGINQYETFKNGTLTDIQRNGTYKIANVGTANNDKTVTYKQPSWTQYKVGRQITDSTPYKDATFKIDQVGTRTRENDTWVHITATDSKNSAANGWILASGLTDAEAPIPNDSVQIRFVTNTGTEIKVANYQVPGASKNTQLGNGTVLPEQHIKGIESLAATTLAGTGYQLNSDGKLTPAQQTDLSKAATGGTINVVVTPESSNQAFSNITLNTSSTAAPGGIVDTEAGESPIDKNAFGYSDNGTSVIANNLPTLKSNALSNIKGDSGQKVSESAIKNALSDQGLTDFYVVYQNGVVFRQFVTDSGLKIPAFDGQYEIWHYTYKDVTGDLTVGSTNVNVNYSVQKKKVPLGKWIQPASGTNSWKNVFGNI